MEKKKTYIQESCFNSLYDIKKFFNSQPQIQQHTQHQHSRVYFYGTKTEIQILSLETGSYIYVTDDTFHQIN